MVTLEQLVTAMLDAFKRKGIYRKSEMASYLGYKSPYFSGIINGKEKLNDVFLKKISDELSINWNWIQTGQGPIFAETRPDINDEPLILTGAAKTLVLNMSAALSSQEANIAKQEANIARLAAIVDRLTGGAEPKKDMAG